MPGSSFYCSICKRTITCRTRGRLSCIRYHYWHTHPEVMKKGAKKSKKSNPKKRRRKRDYFMGQLSRPKSDMVEDKTMGTLNRNPRIPRGPGRLWGKGIPFGKEKGLHKQKNLMGPLVKREEDLWGKDE